MRHLDKFYIGGKWVRPHSSKAIDVINPATEEPFLSMACSNEADVDAAVAAARAAFSSWSQTSAAERKRLLLAAADEMDARLDDLIDATVSCVGIPRHQTFDFQVGSPIDAVRYYARLCGVVDEVREDNDVIIMREPIGVCALINPWNYPFMQLIGKAAPALAAGCTVVANRRSKRRC